MPTFSDKVYELLLTIPKGKVTTYKAIAHALGIKSYRAVGQALKRNPDAPRIPCHRVVSSDGKIGGFMGQRTGSAIAEKIVRLREEGVFTENGWVKDFDQRLYIP
jgi:methylated-DNA-[protein]-cysteine S-methyltransferase